VVLVKPSVATRPSENSKSDDCTLAGRPKGGRSVPVKIIHMYMFALSMIRACTRKLN
jgi:hypothetical protein